MTRACGWPAREGLRSGGCWGPQLGRLTCPRRLVRLMRRGPKPTKTKETKRPVGRKSPANEDSRVRSPEQWLHEAIRREAKAQEQRAATAEFMRLHTVVRSYWETSVGEQAVESSE